MKILVTGAAGFIGSHLAKHLLERGDEVVGYDNVNDYYDPKIKWDRVDRLKEYDDFRFVHGGLEDKDILNKTFEEHDFDKVVNLAAQAGVRYSIEHPDAYVNSNLVGFLNILEACRHNGNIDLVYASSSSVYGGNTKIPFSADDRVDNPISLYAATKKSNELMAHVYSHLFELNTTGLRFFTVYGPWGRPDMALFKFTDLIVKGKPIDVYNFGRMERDFTYIDDIVAGVTACIDKPFRYEVFNLGNNNPENLEYFISLIEENLGMKAEKNYLPMQPGDVPKTYADIDKSKEMLGYEPKTSLADGVKKFINWYKEYYNLV
ncbi:MAG: NAD-dependent epimerase [Thermoplasmatota archaeon]